MTKFWPLPLINFWKGNSVPKLSSKKIAWIGALFGMAVLIIIFDNFWGDYNLQEGQESTTTIVAPTYIEVIDVEKTDELRIAAADKVVKAYDFDLGVEESMLSMIAHDIQKAKEIATTEGTNPEEKLQKIEELIAATETNNDNKLAQVLELQADDFDQMYIFIEDIIRKIWNAGIKAEDVASIQRIVENQIQESGWNSGGKQFMLAVVTPRIMPNMILNEELTQARVDEAIAKVPEVRKQIMQGQIIISEGEKVTRQHIVELESLGLQNSAVTWQGVFGQLLLLVLLFLLLVVYLLLFKPDILHDERKLFLLACILLFVISFAKMIYFLADANRFAGYLIPSATGSLLVALLLDKRAGLFVSVIVGMLVGIISGFSFQFTIFAIISSLVAVFSISHLNQRTDLIRAALIVGIAGFATVFALELFTGNTLLQVLQVSSLGFINGVAASILAGGLLPFLEGPFGIVTEARLLEINNTASDLINRLSREAPGTHQHSLIVANLAESAAKAINASALLARAGALYHDIGKLKRPLFFIENQGDIENPHDSLSPSLSTLIIVAHPRDGADLAKKEKLPAEVIDIIRQHHGTSILTPFYRRALEMEKIEKKHKIIVSDFRYPGPKPKSKEAAIVMLADSVEAALRVTRKPTAGVVDEKVKEIIKDRLADGQLDEAELTLHEIDLLTKTFAKVLNSYYHGRINYPDEKEILELERRRGNGSKN